MCFNWCPPPLRRSGDRHALLLSLGEDASAGDHHGCPDLNRKLLVCVCVCNLCICYPFLLDSAFYFNFTLSIQVSTSYIVTSCQIPTGILYVMLVMCSLHEGTLPIVCTCCTLVCTCCTLVCTCCTLVCTCYETTSRLTVGTKSRSAE